MGDPVGKAMEVYGSHARKRVDIYGTPVITVDGGGGTYLRLDAQSGATIDSMEAGWTSVIGYVELCG